MLINTTLGEMDDSLLKKVEGSLDNLTETTTWVEYYFNDELVHRSVNMTLKQSAFLQGNVSSF